MLYDEYVLSGKYLMHHGVKGQQWGVRRGPPYPIENNVLPKGTKLKSVNFRYKNPDQYKNTGRWIYTYRPEEEWDNKVYKGPFAVYCIKRGAQWLAEHEYETTKDLKMPTSKERYDMFKSLNKNVIQSDINYFLSSFASSYGDKFNPLKNAKVKNYTEDQWKLAYEAFNHLMERNDMFSSTREYTRKISKIYDAMVDDNNQSRYNDARDPIIIFKGRQYLRSIGTEFISYDEIMSNFDEVKTEMNKQGKNVKL